MKLFSTQFIGEDFKWLKTLLLIQLFFDKGSLHENLSSFADQITMRILIFTAILSFAHGKNLDINKGIKLLPINNVKESMESNERKLELLIKKGEVNFKKQD